MIGIGRSFSPSKDRSGIVVFDGDSITGGFGLLQNQDWGSVSMALLGGVYNQVNTSVGGRTLVDILNNLSTATAHFNSSWRSNVISFGPSGLNDLIGGASAATIQSRRLALVAATRAALPAAKIHFATIMPAAEIPDDSIRAAANVLGIAQAAANNYVISDFGNIPQAQDSSNRTYFQGDGNHPTAALDAIMGSVAAPDITAILA